VSREQEITEALDASRERVRVMGDQVAKALRRGAFVRCPECGDRITGEYVVIELPTERRTVRTCVIHPECIPPELDQLPL
jgi:RNA polymerase-binding transcription factor DksA